MGRKCATKREEMIESKGKKVCNYCNREESDRKQKEESYTDQQGKSDTKQQGRK